jgi:hypothetical protein
VPACNDERVARIGALVSLVALLLAVSAAAGGPATKVKNTRGWIEAIDMDGARVAYDVRSSSCNKLFVWNVRTGGAARVSGKGTCGADSTSTGGGVTQIAVAGTQVAWITNLGGNTESNDALYTATLPRPKEKRLAGARRTGDVGGTLTGGWIGGLVGDGDLIAVNTWTTGGTGEVTDAALRLIRRTKLMAIATGLPVVRAASADAGRIAVARSDGTVALYSRAGAVLRSIVPSSVKEVALQGGDLAVLTNSSAVEVYSASTGYRRAIWPVQAGAARLDLASGVAVYAVNRAVHVVRLADGKDVALAEAPRAVVGLEIEAPGVVYAYNTLRRGKEVGNLAFVPTTKAISLLG